MLKTGILNPHILSLLASVRHTNTIVISDRGFPFWPQIETVDISLCDDIPERLDVVRALRPNFVAGKAWMAQEFLKREHPKTQATIQRQRSKALKSPTSRTKNSSTASPTPSASSAPATRSNTPT